MVCVFYVSLMGMAYSLGSEISIIFLIIPKNGKQYDNL